MGLLDTFLADPMQQDGGYLAQLLGAEARPSAIALPSSMYAGSQGLLGNSPLGNAIRGALAGSASSVGYKGLSALGAGFLGGEQAAAQRRQQMMGTADNNLTLARTLALMGMGPFAGSVANSSSPSSRLGGQAAGTRPNGAPTGAAAGADDDAQGGSASAPGYLDEYRNWMDVAQRMAMFGGSDAMVNLYKARAEDSPGFMVYKQQTQNGLQLAPDGRTWMNPDGSLNAAATKAGATALAQALNARSDLRPGSTATIGGRMVAEAPTLQTVTDPKSGRKSWVDVYPDGRIVPLGSGGGEAAPSAGSSPSTSAAATDGLPPSLWTAQQYVESHFDAKAVSPAGATGPAQFTPATAKQYGGNGTEAQQAYMGDLYRKYGSLPVALAAYNWGPANVDLWLKSGGDPQKLPPETRAYIAKVLNLTGLSAAGTDPSASSAGASPSDQGVSAKPQ